MSRQCSDHYIRIDKDLDGMDETLAESKASYQGIKDYVLAHTMLKVSFLYIVQVKAKRSIIERECYYKAKTEAGKRTAMPAGEGADN